jgi:hypothetical protein
VPLKRRQFFGNLSYACLGLLAFFVVFSNALLNAQGAAAISQSFLTADNNLTTGALMSLKTGSNNTAELATIDNVQRLVGVVGNDTLVELGNGTGTQVVTSGVTLALVSDANGSINAGDKITASPIAGIGQKAITSAQVIGIAQAGLNPAAAQIKTLTAQDGSQVQVHIAKIPVQVNVTFYVPPGSQATFLPAFLQDFANAVSGREVSPVRVVISALILFLAFVSIAVLLYSTVRSSIISIGRNPLSEKAVRKSIFQIGFTVMGILLLTLITIYLILTT